MPSSRTSRPTELIIALDYANPLEALALIEKLKSLPVIYKVGFELFLAAGPEFVRGLVKDGCRIFLDLKFHDIPNTVRSASRCAAELGVEMATLHLAGGRHMIQGALEETRRFGAKPLLLGVSVLTSFCQEDWGEMCQALWGGAIDGEPPKVDQSVFGLVESGVSWGIRGVVCSAYEVAHLSSRFPELYTVVPGIRPEGAEAGDQARVMTPREAHAAGARAIVMGRPITRAADPRAVVERTLSQLRSS